MKKVKESSFLLSTRVSLSFPLLSLHAAYASQTAYVTHWIFRAPAHFNSMLITIDLLFALQQSFKTLSASTSSSERAKGLLLSLDRVTHPLQLWATCVVIVWNILQYCTMGIQGKERQCFPIRLENLIESFSLEHLILCRETSKEPKKYLLFIFVNYKHASRDHSSTKVW